MTPSKSWDRKDRADKFSLSPPRLANEASRKLSALCMAKNKLPETSSSSITAAIYSVSSFSVV